MSMDSAEVTITSFQRLYLKSSKCGSVIHLNGDQGRLTLDDYVCPSATSCASPKAHARKAAKGRVVSIILSRR